MEKVIVIGAGPTGLFATTLLLERGYAVDLYDQKSKAGRKLLLAGKSGLNITNIKDPEDFDAAYKCRQDKMALSLNSFTPADLRHWLRQLGVETYVGSTGLVFPLSHSTETILSIWMDSLVSRKNFTFFPDHRLVSVGKESLCFETKNKIINLKAPLVVMGLGGASYPVTGSDGKWRLLLESMELETIPFKPANCGFECTWSPFFKEKINYTAIKNIKLTFQNKSKRGEAVLTSYGIEGGPIYHYSREIRDSIEQYGRTTVFLDLLPDLTSKDIFCKLNRKRGKTSLSNHLRKQLKLSGIKILLLRELTEKIIFNDYSLLAKAIKGIPLILERPRPIEEAISSSGGVAFTELDSFFMLKKYPGWFTAGEMVDWDAPTGGYLLQGCFSTAYTAVEGINKITAIL
ncbi:MAG: TIGR03862 family flavoprotein [Spirochaetales bacterium]|nr:TIGR03862 family flavoprotein [Spirochaetales bacterium]